MLAILGDLGEKSPHEVLRMVVEDIRRQSEFGLKEDQYINQLRMLLQLRNLENQLEKVMESITTFFKEERDVFYKRGAEKERQKAQQELLETARKFKEFGVSDDKIAKATGLSIEEIKKL